MIEDKEQGFFDWIVEQQKKGVNQFDLRLVEDNPIGFYIHASKGDSKVAKFYINKDSKITSSFKYNEKDHD